MFHPGQKVKWHRLMKGGYGYTEIVPAVVLGMTPMGRIRIEARTKDGRSVTRCVKQTSLTKEPRCTCADFDGFVDCPVHI